MINYMLKRSTLHFLQEKVSNLRNKTKLQFVFLAFIVTACSNSTIEKNPSDYGLLQLEYSFDELEVRGRNATNSEKLIESVTLIFYDSSDQVYAGYTTSIVSEGSNTITLNLPPDLREGMSYKVLALANLPKYVYGDFTVKEYMESKSSLLYSEMKEEFLVQTANQRVVTPLPFSGVIIGKNGEEALFIVPPKDVATLSVSLKLTRLVSRFNLQNLVADKLIIESVKVGNYRESAYAFDSSGTPNGKVISGIGQSSVGVVPKAPVVDNKQSFTEGGLYAFPNLVSHTLQDDKETTCLLIAGYYQEEGAEEVNTTKLTYYRANIGKNGLRQILRSNYLYTIIITNVLKEGAEDESGAMEETDLSLEYEVGENWQVDDENMVTDDKGNFILTSKTFVVFDNFVQQGEIINIKVNNGAKWSIRWKPDYGEADKSFDLEIINEGSIHVNTKEENNTPFLKRGILIVSLNNTEISLEISVIQLSLTGDKPLLVVEGKTGAFDYVIPGQGGVVSLQVLTGGKSGWYAEYDNDLEPMISSIVSEGADKAYVDINFNPNTTKSAREALLVVKRRDGNTQIEDVHVKFIQRPAPQLISLTPNVGEAGLIIEGFSADRVNINGVVHTQKFWVNLADKENYNFEVRTTFKKETDAFVFIVESATLEKKYLDLKSAYKTSDFPIQDKYVGSDQDVVLFNVFRTGPGDLNIRGSIIFTAVPKEGTTGLQTEELSVPVVIKTNCTVGDVIIGDNYITDRNVGTPSRLLEPIALNYSYKTYHPDISNLKFRGNEYIYERNEVLIEAACAKHQKENYKESELEGIQLTLMDANYDSIFNSNFIISKERVFLCSDLLNDKGQHVGTYLPYSDRWYWLVIRAGTQDREYTVINNVDGLKSKFTKGIGFFTKPTTGHIRCVGKI